MMPNDDDVDLAKESASRAPTRGGPEIPKPAALLPIRPAGRRLDVELAYGSIASAVVPAYVIGVFRNVAPSGAASALDDYLEGAIQEVFARRMFNATVGKVYLLPVPRGVGLSGDLVALVGMGDPGRLVLEAERRSGTPKFAAANAMRTLLRAGVKHFATVLFGASSGLSVVESLNGVLDGVLTGLRDLDTDGAAPRVVICESDRGRFDDLRRAAGKIARSRRSEGIAIRIDPIELAPARSVVVPKGRVVYLTVQREGWGKEHFRFQSSLLSTGSQAAVPIAPMKVERSVLEGHLELARKKGFDPATGDFGRRLAELVLPPEILERLRADDRAYAKAHIEGREPEEAPHLVVVHDSAAAQIPWETLALSTKSAPDDVADWFPACKGGLSRRYLADHLSVAKWEERLRKDPTLRVLLIADPTEDLPAAREEGVVLPALLKPLSMVQVTTLFQAHATRARVLEELTSEKYDIVHYAGHAFFDEHDAVNSGILCAGFETLSGKDLALHGSLPSLLFCNACESGRVGRWWTSRDPEAPAAKDRGAEVGVGFAEALLRGGIANYVGTHWPVEEAAAKLFALRFYSAIVAGKTVGAALVLARAALRAENHRDWANYIHFGNPHFSVKDLTKARN